MLDEMKKGADAFKMIVIMNSTLTEAWANNWRTTIKRFKNCNAEKKLVKKDYADGCGGVSF